jgi:hypothetical protein
MSEEEDEAEMTHIWRGLEGRAHAPRSGSSGASRDIIELHRLPWYGSSALPQAESVTQKGWPRRRKQEAAGGRE